MAAVKAEEILGEAVTQGVDDPMLDIVADPGIAQEFAFDAEEGDLVERIYRPEPRIELQAVDDPDRIGKPNMFGSQIAKPVDNVTVTQAICDQLRFLGEEPVLGLIDPPDEPGRKAEPRLEENPLVIVQASVPAGEMAFPGNKDGAGTPVEGNEPFDEAIDLRSGKLMCRESVFQCLVFIEAAHDDQPVNDLPRPADGEALCSPHERYDILIDILREAAVQRQFRAASRFASGKRREIEIRKPHRLLQLEDLVTGEKDP